MSAETSFRRPGRGADRPAASAPPGYAAGQVVVGRYLVRELVGRGPRGLVYRAEDLVVREDVALRLLRPELCPDDGARLRFLRRATAARALASPYVGGVRDAFVDELEGQLACVAVGDFLRQPTLAARVAQRLTYQAPFLPVEVASIVSQLGVGLSAIHRAGLSHGNFRARNVFFAGDEVRIGDVAFCPPGAGPADDTYALAALTAEMLGYERAIDEIPMAVRATLDRALSRNARERFGDVDALATALLTAFERAGRPGAQSFDPATPPPEPGAARASHGEASAAVAGALQAWHDPARHLQSQPPRRAPSVLVDPAALDARTPPPAAPAERPTPTLLPVVATPTPPLPPYFGRAAALRAQPLPAFVPAALRPAVRVPAWVIVVLFAGAASLAGVVLRRLVDAHFEEQAAASRVEKARLLARLRAAAPPPPAPAPAPVPRLACEGELRLVPGLASCIAAHEYPAARLLPRVGVTLDEARALCAEHGQRLCRRDEWQRACGGGGARLYPYGAMAQRDRCNATAAGERAHPLARGGKFSRCRTPDGVYDLVGNAGEWVEEGVVMGGDAASSAVRSRCTTARPAPATGRGPLVGFRCCAN